MSVESNTHTHLRTQRKQPADCFTVVASPSGERADTRSKTGQSDQAGAANACRGSESGRALIRVVVLYRVLEVLQDSIVVGVLDSLRGRAGKRHNLEWTRAPG